MTVAQAEVLYQAGDYQTALRVVKLALSGDLGKVDYVHALHLGGLCERRLGQYQAAFGSFTYALRLAPECDPDRLGVLTLDLGATLCCVGDFAVGTDLLHQSLAHPLSLSHEAKVLCELAYANEVYGQRQDAITLYLQGRDLYRLAGDRSGESDCLLRAAWCYLQNETPMAAAPLLSEAESLSPHLADRTAPHQALYLYLIGDSAGAMEICTEAMSRLNQHSQGDRYHWELGELNWIAAMQALDAQLFDATEALAENALAHAMRLEWSDLVNRANKVRVQARRARVAA